MGFELKDGTCYLFDAETGNFWTSFPTTGMTATIATIDTATIGTIETEKEEEMIKIIDVDVDYVKKTFVDKTQRDKNGNYMVTKKEVPVATIVTFENGNIQIAVCDENDEFNLETGISICVTRELMGRLYGISNKCASPYNKIIRQGMKAYKNRCKIKKINEKLIAEQKAIEKNRKIKEQKRREKRAAKKKEREIEILTEAIKRANADSNK